MILMLLMQLFVKNTNSLEMKDYPYLVSIGFVVEEKDVHTCTGSLVQANWVVTVGDCIAKEKSYFVSFPSHTDEAHVVYKTDVLERFLHPGYKRPTFSTNIAVLLVQEVIAVPIVPKLSMDDYSHKFGEDVLYIGYWTKDNAKIDELGLDDCVINRCMTMTTYVICVKKKDQTSHNWFASGGLLIHEGTLIGLYLGKVDEYMGRFVPIRANYHWIDQIIHENMHNLRLSVTFSVELDEK